MFFKLFCKKSQKTDLSQGEEKAPPKFLQQNSIV